MKKLLFHYILTPLTGALGLQIPGTSCVNLSIGWAQPRLQASVPNPSSCDHSRDRASVWSLMLTIK